MATLNKANARDIAKARALLNCDGGHRYYAETLSVIHRSSSAAQQQAVEQAIIDDGMTYLFMRHPTNGCMLSAANAEAA